MRTVIVTDVPHPDADHVERLRSYGVATIHEALGRTGSLGPDLRPVQQGLTIAGRAVTALCWPGDNLMIHAAIEQCGPGDVLVVATVTPSGHGMFGDLFATALRHRGVPGVVIDAGVRDTETLREMGFGAWSRHVSPQGTVKASAGSVNLPVVIGGQVVEPGDVVVADDDGVVCVPRLRTGEAVDAAAARAAKEDATRAAFEEGELGLDRYGLRPLLERLGVTYEPWREGR
ncbi:4-carboxy-4-hydroxy-2-oxoadipate aldolase/oxaloacetate decarboxylase [Nocardioides sp. Root1257]|uniref:4-carboxy-4-hydroxy-2-oxoadipate aldolase/oxaloacetate decarboxylase n=1 Tax=unclassified Nocardioides TaxID=2615069 RepID=UPI0006F2C05D|nr:MULTISPECIES: 4-carboxy-4-hydroxy-2-oxoadipate aldolase/oxaloacetate decarboxylase [unclassified Nocardioides]KQW46928.1 4-carboxy-4-hydroxy-2-oxoadipate aldolase/oxaloacetate decarboxylase [Nocardioides sp. Root1257]KRC43675.1 4-carboxy-4-hydroxy-2-oxoadipate aldolase/oxaloacetate decarboxylase [Nocardioides sp. Root224]